MVDGDSEFEKLAFGSVLAVVNDHPHLAAVERAGEGLACVACIDLEALLETLRHEPPARRFDVERRDPGRRAVSGVSLGGTEQQCRTKAVVRAGLDDQAGAAGPCNAVPAKPPPEARFRIPVSSVAHPLAKLAREGIVVEDLLKVVLDLLERPAGACSDELRKLTGVRDVVGEVGALAIEKEVAHPHNRPGRNGIPAEIRIFPRYVAGSRAKPDLDGERKVVGEANHAVSNHELARP